jgi:hypothetical protein
LLGFFGHGGLCFEIRKNLRAVLYRKKRLETAY